MGLDGNKGDKALRVTRVGRVCGVIRVIGRRPKGSVVDDTGTLREKRDKLISGQSSVAAQQERRLKDSSNRSYFSLIAASVMTSMWWIESPFDSLRLKLVG